MAHICSIVFVLITSSSILKGSGVVIQIFQYPQLVLEGQTMTLSCAASSTRNDELYFVDTKNRFVAAAGTNNYCNITNDYIRSYSSVSCNWNSNQKILNLTFWSTSASLANGVWSCQQYSDTNRLSVLLYGQ